MMLHLAVKAFYPAKLPFPLIHVDTTWKFREMIAFRDETAKRLGIDLIVHINQEGVARGINPIVSGSSLHTQVMKTDALKQALDIHGFDAAFGGARRDEEKSRAKERIFSFRSTGHALGPAQSAAGTMESLQHPYSPGRDDAGIRDVELDRARCVGVHHAGEDPGRASLFCEEAPGGAPERDAHHGRRRPPATGTQ